ncbi:hypothetical protein J2W49_001925 [Hydrogenophaga palleronii]|uniref:Transglycosylase SLT domain-containing protein n=1 Tax=Hydrogenophaga palleronii TaxID=65655 RepID=A0ABU1WKZ4_9BURK|nr:hypothetical protein [Hydrogenophaga palleronii]
MIHHRPLWRVACLAALLASPSEAAVRYRCEMPDGNELVAMQDLSARFGGAVRRCTAFETSEPEAVPTVLRTDGILPGLEKPIRPRPLRPVHSATPLMQPLIQPPMHPLMPPSVLDLQPPGLRSMVAAASARQGLDPRLVVALVQVESAYRPHARSPKGALGLMQIMPATGARYGVDTPQALLDPATNIDVGTRYLRDLHRLFDGQIELVLAAYNAGEGAVKRYGNRIPPYRETQNYVRKILGLYRDR